MKTIGRRDLLLLVIGLDERRATTGQISGITRLQKLLFLLEQEEHIVPSGKGFEFEPYKAGPCSRRLYDDLELLENLGLVRSEATAESTTEETSYIDGLSFDDLIVEGNLDDLDRLAKAPDSREERRFALTEEGKKRVKHLLENGELDPIANGIRTIKSRFSHYSLRDLLRYVYTKYEGMATESEIVDQILGKRRT